MNIEQYEAAQSESNRARQEFRAAHPELEKKFAAIDEVDKILNDAKLPYFALIHHETVDSLNKEVPILYHNDMFLHPWNEKDEIVNEKRLVHINFGRFLYMYNALFHQGQLKYKHLNIKPEDKFFLFLNDIAEWSNNFTK